MNLAKIRQVNAELSLSMNVPDLIFLSSIYLGLRMQGVSRLPNSTLYVVEPGYLGLFLALPQKT